MNGDFECIHCGHIDYSKNHWKKCEDHPAHKFINKLVDEIKQLKEQLIHDDNRAWEALGKPEGTYDTTNVERLCKQTEANKALFEICANAIIQHYQALEDDLPAKAESFLQELLKALYIYCPKESADGTFSELARKMRLHIFTFKD